MFEHAILVTSLIPEKKARAEILPRLVFDEYDFTPRREHSSRPSRLSRFLSRQQAAGSRQ